MSFRTQLLLLGYTVLTISESIEESKCDVTEHYDKVTAVCPNLSGLQRIKSPEQVTSLRITNCSDSTGFQNMTFQNTTFENMEDLTYDCTLSQMPSYVFSTFSKLKRISIPKCNISRLLWQSVYNVRTTNVFLKNCPIPCDCNHEWLTRKGEFAYVERPNRFIYSCAPKCPRYGISTNRTEYYVKAGDSISIDVHVEDQFVNITNHRQYFEWRQYYLHVHQEIITNTTMTLKMDNISIHDLGEVVAVCWHCLNYQQVVIKLFVISPISVEFVSQKHEDSDLIKVEGWPINNLTLQLTHVSSNRSEIHSMNDETAKFFFDSLIVDPQQGPYEFQREFRVSLNALAHGDHITGLVRFEICVMGKDCQSIEKELWYLGQPRSTTPLPPEVENISSYWTDSGYLLYLIGFAVFCFVLTLLLMYKRFGLRHFFYQRVLTNTSNQNPVDITELELRRASAETDETFIGRLEQASLASDYTNQTVEFIDIGKIQVHEVIGKGAFGQVYKGSWQKLGTNTIAIKTIHQVNQTIEQEAAVLYRLNHPNIVRLYGMTKKDNTLLLVLELMNLGELRKYLRDRRPAINGSYSQFPPPLTPKELRKIIIDIVKGLAYLHTQQVIHRDLATRNCLVSGETDLRTITASQRPPTVVKISDFGMSKRLLDSDYYVMQGQGLLPIRWMPPEAVITQKFSLQTDIWALGVTMWEVLNYGDVPFGNVATDLLVATAMSGNTPEQTSFCSDEMYALMRRCWNKEPDQRITVDDILLDSELHTEFSNGGATFHQIP